MWFLDPQAYSALAALRVARPRLSDVTPSFVMAPTQGSADEAPSGPAEISRGWVMAPTPQAPENTPVHSIAAAARALLARPAAEVEPVWNLAYEDKGTDESRGRPLAFSMTGHRS
jgi:hypothetical protein